VREKKKAMRLLLCVDDMPYAETALQFGGVFAHATQSTVTLLHVIHQEQDRTSGQHILTTAREMLPGIEVDTLVRCGNPTSQILAESRQGGHDLLIVGARQASGTKERLLGSVTQQIIQRAPISVLVVKKPVTSLACLLACTGGANVSEAVIRVGGWLAEMTDAQVTLLHVVGPVPSMYTGFHEIEETLPQLLQTDTPIARHLRLGAEILAQHQADAKLRLRHGIAADEILEETVELSCDLVVIGASGTAGRLSGLLMGNVTRQIVEHAPCAVLVTSQTLQNSIPTKYDEHSDA
jgi:nucleotide-binding universal stress UspA family protein